ncbi:uncharacterized protein LOC110436812 [Sorghum bicolor]|uniref:uncharacterized protein LOC110436812 n=1 Tax=Sorghum bicolor TaxID=4558 RepID=UPI000B4238F0|nr:uncharacterized protein LOC110436812 [Sorghum bicolor]|eukprot:XP_021320004.1 uncharacterized protein LOC110436812 [Sorghum bicolor]
MHAAPPRRALAGAGRHAFPFRPYVSVLANEEACLVVTRTDVLYGGFAPWGRIWHCGLCPRRGARHMGSDPEIQCNYASGHHDVAGATIKEAMHATQVCLLPYSHDHRTGLPLFFWKQREHLAASSSDSESHGRRGGESGSWGYSCLHGQLQGNFLD